MSPHNPITSVTNCCSICLPAPDGDRLVGYTLLPENGCAVLITDQLAAARLLVMASERE